MDNLVTSAGLTTHLIQTPDDLQRYWDRVDLLTFPINSQRYYVGCISSAALLQATLQLRYQVFAVELGHTTATGRMTGLDSDKYDQQMHHIVLICRETHQVVGTYRVQTSEIADANAGFYSANEYDLAPLGDLRDDVVELGRACVAKAHRNANSLLLLWSAVRFYATLHNKRFFFGCCSLNSQDPHVAWSTYHYLKEQQYFHPDYLLQTQTEFNCPLYEVTPADIAACELPKLFRVYLRLGAKIFSVPALDQEFGTIDFLAIIDALDTNLSAVTL